MKILRKLLYVLDAPFIAIYATLRLLRISVSDGHWLVDGTVNKYWRHASLLTLLSALSLVNQSWILTLILFTLVFPAFKFYHRKAPSRVPLIDLIGDVMIYTLFVPFLIWGHVGVIGFILLAVLFAGIYGWMLTLEEDIRYMRERSISPQHHE